MGATSERTARPSEGDGGSLGAALGAWRQVVGDEAVVAPSDAACGRRGGERFAATLLPRSRDEVARCLIIAGQHGARVRVVSAGCNWGYGALSGAPERSRGGATVLLDLSRMKAIRAYSEELGTITVEPGVTFGEVHAFLRAQGSASFVGTTGAGPRASLIGNAMERGDGSGPWGDRAGHLLGLEVVLPTGEVLAGGFSRYGAGPLAGLHGLGLGPSLDGLFTQSSLGVVTAATFPLAPRPAALSLLRFAFRRDAAVGPATAALRRLRQEGTLREGAALWNHLRALSALVPRPSGPPAAPDEDHAEALARRLLGPFRWFGTAAVSGASEALVRAGVERVREVMGPLAEQLRVESIHVENASAHPVAGVPPEANLDPAAAFFQGVPHEASLRSCYWRQSAIPVSDLDPERDGCGLLWATASVPATSEEIALATALGERETRAQGFDPLLAVLVPGERTAIVAALLVVDPAAAPNAPGSASAARACFAALGRAWCARGFLPHRLGAEPAPWLPSVADDSEAVLQRVKRALDPEGSLANDRYGPR